MYMKLIICRDDGDEVRMMRVELDGSCNDKQRVTKAHRDMLPQEGPNYYYRDAMDRLFKEADTGGGR